MEKYIKRSDLSSVMDTLTEKALEHADKLSVELNLCKFTKDVILEVVVRDVTSFDTITKEAFRIIPDPMDDYDVAAETINAALKKIAEAEKLAAEVTPSNNE
jgi:hypothetical protein